jgi:hypothetical protein
LALAPGLARAGSTTALAPGAALSAVRLAVDAGGGAAALYPARRHVWLQRAAPGEEPVRVPLPAGASVESFVGGPAREVALLYRVGRGCSPLGLLRLSSDDTWHDEALGPPNASSAALAADPDGDLSALVADCAGNLVDRLRAPDGIWGTEALGLRVGPDARVALASGGDGLAVAAATGRRALVAVRGPGGGWRSVGLPGGPVRARDTVSEISVAIDAQGRPVALAARGPSRPPDAAQDVLGHPRRLAARLDGGVWAPITGDPPSPVTLAGAGRAFALLGRDGQARLETAAGTVIEALRVRALAVGPEGTLADVPATRPGVLGVGAPPSLEVERPRPAVWGAPVALVVRVVDGGRPVAGVLVRAGGLARAAPTGADGVARLRLLAVRSATLHLDIASPGPAAPAFATVRVVVRPRSASLAGRATRRGRRVAVRGRVSGGVRLPGPLGRVWLVDLAEPPRSFLPGRPLASTGRRRFHFRVHRRSGARLALFYEGRVLRLHP